MKGKKRLNWNTGKTIPTANRSLKFTHRGQPVFQFKLTGIVVPYDPTSSEQNLKETVEAIIGSGESKPDSETENN